MKVHHKGCEQREKDRESFNARRNTQYSILGFELVALPCNFRDQHDCVIKTHGHKKFLISNKNQINNHISWPYNQSKSKYHA